MCRCVPIPVEDDDPRVAGMSGGVKTTTKYRGKIPGEKGIDISGESGIIEGERGISRKAQTANADNAVNLEYINSKEYKNKFERLTEYNEDVRETLYKRSKAMLTHRSKTDKEDMYLIDIESGKVVGEQTASKSDFGVDYNESLKKAVASVESHTLVSIHNHPTNLPPTGSDFASAGAREYHSGVVVCHNGKVYWYKMGAKKFKTTLIDDRIEKYNILYRDSINNHEKVLNEIKQEYGIDWRELK